MRGDALPEQRPTVGGLEVTGVRVGMDGSLNTAVHCFKVQVDSCFVRLKEYDRKLCTTVEVNQGLFKPDAHAHV